MTKKDKDSAPSAQTDAQDDAAGKKKTLVRHSLGSLAGLIHEGCRVYRLMRDGDLNHAQGRSLVWVLAQLRAMVETQALERLEARLEELAPSIEGKSHGHPAANRTPQSTH